MGMTPSPTTTGVTVLGSPEHQARKSVKWPEREWHMPLIPLPQLPFAGSIDSFILHLHNMRLRTGSTLALQSLCV